MKTLTRPINNHVDNLPTWYTNDGGSILIQEMETSHCFYSLRMVWNATMPEALKEGIREPKKWKIDNSKLPYYRKILPHLLRELLTRRDLDAVSFKELELIRERASKPVPPMTSVEYFEGRTKVQPSLNFATSKPRVQSAWGYSAGGLNGPIGDAFIKERLNADLPPYHPKMVAIRYHERTQLLDRLYKLMRGYQTPHLPMGAGMAAEFNLIMGSLKELEA